MAVRSIPALVAAVALALFPIAARAQSRGASGGSSHGYHGAYFGGTHFGRSFAHRDAGFFPGYFGDYPLFYDDSLLDQPSQNYTQPLYALQPPAAAAPKPSPLLIELEGDRYVRYGGATQLSGTDKMRPGPVREPRSAESARQIAVSHAQLAPTVLIYRDGHREQIPEYAIVGRTLYAPNRIDTTDASEPANDIASRAAQPSYGLRNIQLSTLDIPATMKANRENGVNFVLPTASNEVVTRP